MGSLYENDSVDALREAAFRRVSDYYMQCGEACPLAFVSRWLNRRAGRLSVAIADVVASDPRVFSFISKRGGLMLYPVAAVKEEYGEDGLAVFERANGRKI